MAGAHYDDLSAGENVGSAYIFLLSGPPPASITGTQVVTNGAFGFGFTSDPGWTWTALGSTNAALPLSDWTVLGGLIEVWPGEYQFTDPQATDFSWRYYRIRSP